MSSFFLDSIITLMAERFSLEAVHFWKSPIACNHGPVRMVGIDQIGVRNGDNYQFKDIVVGKNPYGEQISYRENRFLFCSEHFGKRESWIGRCWILMAS